MTYSKWIKTLFITLFIFFLFIVGVNYTIDPMQQYRISSFYPIHFKSSKQRYLNAGLAKNYDYDSIVLGTSHTKNFLISDIQNSLKFKKPIKLTISGGSAREQSITLQTAIENNKNIKNVLWGLDLFSFKGISTRERHGEGTFPMYLYDQNIFNDYKYLVSFNTIENSFKALSYPYRKSKRSKFDYNRMYCSEHKKDFTFNNIIKGWKKSKEKYSKSDKKVYSFENFKNSFNFNFLNIIKDNPQINYKIYFPPYSILKFKVLGDEVFKNTIKFKKYIFHSIGHLPNVKIYDFQIEKKITHDLYNYKDLSHYDQKINIFILEQIKENNYLLTKENINENIEKLKKQVENYKLNKSIKGIY